MSKDKIISGAEVASIKGAPNYREFIIGLARRKAMLYTGKLTNKMPVKARIDFGRWIADCECGGAEYVDPDDPVFYCQSCGNLSVEGKLRKVVFPQAEERAQIEKAVLERPVQVLDGLDAANQALRSRAVDGIPRCWNPGETAEQLREQHKIAKQAVLRRKEGKNGV